MRINKAAAIDPKALTLMNRRLRWRFDRLFTCTLRPLRGPTIASTNETEFTQSPRWANATYHWPGGKDPAAHPLERLSLRWLAVNRELGRAKKPSPATSMIEEEYTTLHSL